MSVSKMSPVCLKDPFRYSHCFVLIFFASKKKLFMKPNQNCSLCVFEKSSVNIIRNVSSRLDCVR